MLTLSTRLGPASEVDAFPLRAQNSRMDLFVFARLHARPGEAGNVGDAISEVVSATRREPGCLSIQGFRSFKDDHIFYIHSRWIDETAFDIHIGLPHTARFVERVEPLLDHPLEPLRTLPFA